MQVDGQLARILKFVRSNGRCPADDFLGGLDVKMFKKFKGAFQALTTQGSDLVLPERFKALQGSGKPLWAFKEHDHRLYCSRRIVTGKSIEVVLLSGWAKDKTRTDRENREVEHALRIYAELVGEYPGGEK